MESHRDESFIAPMVDSNKLVRADSRGYTVITPLSCTSCKTLFLLQTGKWRKRGGEGRGGEGSGEEHRRKNWDGTRTLVC